MQNNPTTYPCVCTLPLDQALSISEMILQKFPDIEMIIDPELEICDTLPPLIPEEEVLVVFNIPYEEKNMPNFYKEIREIPNLECRHEATEETYDLS